MFRFALRRLAGGSIVLLVIAYASFLAQDLALHSRHNRTAPLTEVAGRALEQGAELVRSVASGDLGSYNPQRSHYQSAHARPFTAVVGDLMLKSAALLALATLVGGLIGGLVGIAAAATRRPHVSLGIMLLSVVGISTPSFFLGMLLQLGEIAFYKRTGIRLVPVGGFGWDEHLVLPVLVLAARPVAQVARLTYVRVQAIVHEDYVRTARSKGLRDWITWARHIVPNAAIAVLTAIGTSLRFSLSSLPVVEVLFAWPGAGQALLQLLRTYQAEQATVLILLLGGVFVLVNVGLEVVYRLIDPRLREEQRALRQDTRWWEWAWGLVLGPGQAVVRAAGRAVRGLRRQAPASAAGDPAPLTALVRRTAPSASTRRTDPQANALARHRALWRAASRNPALLMGGLVAVGLFVPVIAGPRLAPHDAYAGRTRIEVGEQLVTPPVRPTDAYPMGTDRQGRDILSLLLVGARRTFGIALAAVAARLLLGGVLGFLAGWFTGSRLDRALMGLSETLAAFPALLLAMLVVYAVGVRQGMIAFVVGLSFIGWGEVMQTVRSQVLAIRPTAYIEGAVASGLGEGQILSAHVLPNVWPAMVSLAFLEMGGVLMILGELGFLGVFIGGGFAGEGEALPSLVYYDVPEWSVMLANSWRSVQAYPWATLYPAGAFFVAILGFTLLGEGLRQLTERLTLSFRSLFNRYTLVVAVVAVAGGRWMMESTSYAAQHAPAARAFDVSRALDDIAHLSDARYAGRLSGSPEADEAAEWIAAQFEALGLQPAGAQGTYYQSLTAHYRDAAGAPTLTLYDPEERAYALTYGVDYARQPGPYDVGGSGAGDIVLAVGGTEQVWYREVLPANFRINAEEAARPDKVVLTSGTPAGTIGLGVPLLGRSGALMVYPVGLPQRYELFTQADSAADEGRPAVALSAEWAARILGGTPTPLDAVYDMLPLRRSSLYVPTGWWAELGVPVEARAGLTVRNVLAIWPGEDVVLDEELIVVAAHYDGLGVGPGGGQGEMVLYPGANDNASGVATMLETIRTLKAQGFRPKRSILFAAWVGGERREPLRYERLLRAAGGFEQAFTIVAGLQVQGVGAGTGSQAVIQQASSSRLSETLQQAARHTRTPITARGAGLHADASRWPLPSGDIATVTLSWLGADDLAHTPTDTLEAIDPAKLGHSGRLLSLVVMALAADPAY